MSSNKKMRLAARIISMLLIIVMVSEEFLGSGTIVLAAQQEEISVLEENADSGMEETGNGEETEETDISETEEYETENLDILFEVEENRDRSSKHYRLSDGSIMAAEYGMDIHYEEDGLWKDIDNRFIYEAPSEEDYMEGFSTAEGDVKFKFSPDIGNGDVVRATTGNYSVGFEFLPNAAEPEMEISAGDSSEEEGTAPGSLEEAYDADTSTEDMEDTVSVPITFIKGDVLNEEEVPETSETVQAASVSSYAANSVQAAAETESSEDEVSWVECEPEDVTESDDTLMEQASLENVVTSVGYGNVQPGVSLQYIASGSSLKEYILLSGRQDSYVYTFEMNLGNMEAEMQDDGSILLYDPADGSVVYEIPASYMSDAAGAYSNDVEMELSASGEGRYILTLTADAAWINAEERVFPVQIDPTLNVIMDISGNIRRFYAIEGKDGCKEVTTNYGEMIVGFDSGGEEERITYIQLRNLVDIPKNSVLCGAKFYLYAYHYTTIGWPKIHVNLREVTSSTSWSGSYTWETRPQADGLVLDTRTVTSQTNEYVGWDITSLIKKHYENGNLDGQITAFQLRAEGGEDMDYGNCANIWLEFRHTAAKPVFQVFYRDTKGVEDYYTYQVQGIGNAGSAYIGDYNGQLTLVKNLVSYESTALPYSLGIVYNSSYDSDYLKTSEDIHVKNCNYMRVGRGWKLTAQETVMELSLVNLNTTEKYLVYNDSDGTEHYFKQKEIGSSVYEDEDGLGLTITKSGSDFTMKDKKDNLKVFTKGYLTRIEDANGNKIHIVYNGNSYSNNSISDDGTDRITSIWSQPADSTSAKEIFSLEYDVNNCLRWIRSINDLNSVKNKVQLTYSSSDGYIYLAGIGYYDSTAGAYKTMAQYSYLSDTDSSGKKHCYSLSKVFDTESGYGMQYTYYWTASGYRVYTFQEYEADSINGSGRSNGELVRCYSPYLGNSRYRSAGSDGILEDVGANENADDVVTVYRFNSAGQTTNVQSEDQMGNLLGVTSSAYHEKDGTSQKNHRMTETVSSGQAGVNLIANGGFENGDPAAGVGTAESWIKSGGITACRDASNGKNHSGALHFNLHSAAFQSAAQIAMKDFQLPSLFVK